MGRPPKQWNTEPRRVESPARMVVAEAEPVVTEPAMRVADEDVSRAEMAIVIDRIVEDAGKQDIPEDAVPLETLLAVAETIDPNPWRPMDTAHRDGALIEGRDATGRAFPMIWRRTSRYNARAAKWEATGFWSSHLSRVPLGGDVVEWREVEGFNAPGQIAS